MPNNAAAPAELERIWVAADGSVKALYSDNSLLLLSSNGASFTRVPASGTKTVQLTDCCLTRAKPLVAELLAFRNQHLDLPYFPTWLQKQLQDQHGLLFSTGFPVTDTTWSRTAEQAVEAGLVKLLDDTTVQLLSSCESAHITLQHSGLRFAVSYPLLLDYDAASNTYTYTQHTQVFSRSQYPARWRAALAVATAAAQLAAVSSAQHTQEQQEQPQQHTPRAQQDLLRLQQQLREPEQQLLLLGVTNHPAVGLGAAGSPLMVQRHSVAGIHAGAVAETSCSSPRRYGSPVQRQHNPWQAADQLLSCRRQPHPQPAQPMPLSADTGLRHLHLWRSPGNPGSPSAALYAVAEQQQQQHQQLRWPKQSEAGRSCSSSGGGSDRVVQLPLMPEVLRALPQQLQVQQQQRPRPQHMPHAPCAGQRSSSTSSTGDLAAALTEALGQRQQGGGSSGADSACVGSWWLEPHLLLPSDELLHMVWTPDATLIFVEDMNEVEVWLHADQSCLFSFQGGAFVTHLRPYATPAGGGGSSGTGPAAALSVEPWEGLLEGCVDASEVSRVYAASTLPPDMTVPVLLADGSRCANAVVPLGRIATEALRFRSTMERVMASTLAPGASAAAASRSSSSSSTDTGRHLLAARAGCPLPVQRTPAHPPWGQHHQQQTQQQLSLDVTEDQEVPGVGHFTAYADGRVRVLFADRTILSLDADRGQARLILPDGSRQDVPASRPLGVEEYVQAALEFATWSSHTPVQRAAALRMQALVAAELRSSARMAAICEWGSNPGQLPHAVGIGGSSNSNSNSLLLEAGPGQQQPPLLLLLGSSAKQPGQKGVGDGCWALPDVEGLLQANRALLDRL